MIYAAMAFLIWFTEPVLMWRVVLLLALLAAGCGGGGKTSGAPSGRAAGSYALLMTEGFTVPAAEPDSGLMWFRFRVPTTDNAGTCKNPIPDSTASNTDLYCIAWRGRKTDAGYGEVMVDTFWVRRGTTVTYQRRVVADTFLVTFKLCKAQKCGCDVGATQIVPPSAPPTPVLLQP